MAPVRTAGAVVVATAAISISLAVFSYFLFLKTIPSNKKKKPRNGVVDAIGNTPLIRINSLSEATGCEILGKCEFLNPGGSVKDRVALKIIEENLYFVNPGGSVKDRVALKIIEENLYFVNPGGSVKDRVALKIIEEALESGDLASGGVVTEGSAGSTAISLATVAPAYGCKCHVVIPDDAAIEKSQILEALGATVERVRPVSITHRDHYVNIARRRAQEANELAAKNKKASQVDGKDPEQMNGCTCDQQKENPGFLSRCNGGFFADQFENLANFRAHYEGTGPEIWEQTGGNLDAFVAAAGTGGTVAGVSRFLQEKNPKVKCFLIDPPGSGLFNKVTRGVMYTKEEAEGRRLKNPFDTITEGIGINRLTQNFMMAKLDGAFRGTDKEAVEMSRFLLRNDGLFIGSSSAMNCVGALRVARALGPGHIIVTILCDSGMRHLSKFYDAKYLSQYGLTPTATGLEFISTK